MSWLQWKTENHQKLQHVAGYEEMFVDEVLMKIPEIEPDDVVPQYHFMDTTGNRYIDFMIINPSKGYCLPIELDGYAKMLGNGNQYHKFNDFLQRQNAIISQFGLVLRYSNKTMLNNAQLIISEVRDTLRKQAKNKSTAEIKELHTKQLIADYQLQIEQAKQQNQQVNITQNNGIDQRDIDELSHQIKQLKNQLNQKPESIRIVQPIHIVQPAQPVQVIHQVSEKPNNKWIFIALLGMVGVGAAAYWGYKLFNLSASNEMKNNEEQVVIASDVSNLNTNSSNGKSLNKTLINSSQKICGIVAEVAEFKGGTYLNLGGKFPNQEMTITVWKESGLANYVGTKVCVIGVVEKYKGRLSVSVNGIKNLEKYKP